MLLPPFKTHEFNAHYDGAYAESQFLWRQVAARDKVRNIQALLNGRVVNSVLEVGCGTGSVLVEMESRGIGNRFVGVDVSDPNQHVHPGAEKFTMLKYDGNRLPFEDGAFDLVVATHVVEHVPHPRQFLSELARVSKDLVFVEVPCDIRLIPSQKKLQIGLDTGHINGFSPEFFMILLQTSEFNILDFELFNHSWEVQSHGGARMKSHLIHIARGLALKLHPLLASRIFCYHCSALLQPTRLTGTSNS